MSEVKLSSVNTEESARGHGEAARVPETITLGAGCFWCIEAKFKALKGVKRVVSGYSGGSKENPTYNDLRTQDDQLNTGSSSDSGDSGDQGGLHLGSRGVYTPHAEVVQVDFDPREISLARLLQAFWRCHDPTQLNRQGNDIGTQYRSIILYHTEEQRVMAEKVKINMNATGLYGGKQVVTEISAFRKFYKAEAEHHDYFAKHGDAPYCMTIIKPEMDEFLAAFGERIPKPSGASDLPSPLASLPARPQVALKADSAWRFDEVSHFHTAFCFFERYGVV
jgi:peptide-methionine (S)-S-oxide reductase